MLIMFAVNPVFQIGKRTLPMAIAALAGLAADLILLPLFADRSDASGLAMAQSGACFASFVVLAAFAARAGARWPAMRDLSFSVLGAFVMGAAVLPLRRLEPGLLPLVLQILLGAGIYSAIALIFDIAGLRAIAFQVLDRFRALSKTNS
jgi:hypothetical protein